MAESVKRKKTVVSLNQPRSQGFSKFQGKNWGAPFSKVPVVTGPEKLFFVCRVYIQDLEMWSVFTWRHGSHIGAVQNNETAAMLVFQTNPVGVELFSYVNTFFYSKKFAWLLATWVKTLY